ncbi:MAG TPA: branched-chain amino acid ABC transporter ATP-binding protein/permease [Mycobacterium sp.]|nr:branched-chain amino acid ABC transporter ATP-binding protein/permease [Mycobacterium sp.]
MSDWTRSLLEPRRLGQLVLVAAAAGLLLFPVVSDDAYYENMIILSLVFAIGASGLNIIMGYAGYVSLGQGAFIGLGGYTVGVLATKIEGPSPWLWVPVAGLVTAIVAIGLGLVSLRSSGAAFVIITVAFLFLTGVVAANWVGLTNGTSGLTLPLPSWSRDIMNWPFYYALMLLLGLQLVLSWWIRRTKLGMGLMAIRGDETKAATIGINLPVNKILGFVASSVVVGMAGAIYGYYLTFVDPRGMFGILLSVQVVLSVLVGGNGTLWGPVVGAFIVEPLNEVANNNFGGGNVRLYLFGALLMAIVIWLPRGILPSVEQLWRRRRTAGHAGLVGARIAEGASLAKLSISTREQRAVDPERVLLRVSGLTKRFGGITAVDDCSFDVLDGSITGLIGPNGSGKTTVFNLIDNTITPDAGEIWFDDDRIERLPSWSRAHRGVGRTFQITRLFGDMTVLENVVAPQRSFSWSQLGHIAVSGPEARDAEELLQFVGMRDFRDQPARALSYGQQKLVELAQILMLDPTLILLDEPAGGINPVLIDGMAAMIRELNALGKTFLIVEHNMPFVLDLCPRVHVLSRGRTLASGTPQQIQANHAVIDAYLGENFDLEPERAS